MKAPASMPSRISDDSGRLAFATATSSTRCAISRGEYAQEPCGDSVGQAAVFGRDAALLGTGARAVLSRRRSGRARGPQPTAPAWTARSAFEHRYDAPLRMQLRDIHDLPCQPRVVPLAPQQMAHVVVAMSVEPRRHEDHLRRECVQ